MASKDIKKRRETVLTSRRLARTTKRDVREQCQRKIGNKARRKRCKLNLREYLETYHEPDFELEWSDSHLLLIETIQTAVLEGLQQLLVYPRGSGKTSIARRAIQWAALYGHRKYAILFAAEATKSRQHIESIKKDFLTNDLIYQDFPEVTEPVWQCEGIAQRANFQQYDGVSTGLIWGGEFIRFPTIEDFKDRGNQGCAIATGTITGATARGPLMDNVRPDFAIIDDPQTRASAKSPTMISERSDIIEGDILGMAGPGVQMSAVMTATVIYQDDLADEYLDQDRHPDWNGIRISMVQKWPTNTTLWDQWYDIVKECKVNRLPLDRAHEFYKKNRKKMDAGASVYWEERIRKGYVSALESAMEQYYRNPITFASEFQNQPVDPIKDDAGLPSEVELNATRQLPYKPGVVPEWASHRTAFIDVQQSVLFFVECCWADDFTGHILRYGTWPDQGRNYYSKQTLKKTIFRAAPGAGYEGALYKALNALMTEIDESSALPLNQAFIDANFGKSTEIVYRVCKERRRNVWLPSHGKGVGAKGSPLNDRARKPGERRGANWRIMPAAKSTRKQIHAYYETNFWKSFMVDRFRVAVGDPGAMTVYSSKSHQILWDHLHAEYGQLVESEGRSVVEWTAKPNLDNDFLDCLVGNCVAASTLGCTPPGAEGEQRDRKAPARPRAQVNMSRAEGRGSFFITAR